MFDKFLRNKSTYTNRSKQFEYNGDEQRYEKQYNNVYLARLIALRPILTKSAERKYGADVPIKVLADLEENEKCVVVGTIYKQQELKPSILKEYAEETNTLPQPIRTSKFTDLSDKLILEDENLRVLLTGNIEPSEFVTGIVLAFYGCELEGGKFNVEEIIYPEYPALPPSPTFDDDVYVLLVSGLCFSAKSSNDAKHLLNCKFLSDWLCGLSGGVDEQRKISKIARVIIAGNSISDKMVDKNLSNVAKYLTRKTTSPSVEAVQNFDAFLEKLASCVEIDLMPGEFDPANHFVPQQPFHRCMLPKSTRLSTVHNVTNPYLADIADVTFLGTSGQNVDDVYRFCNTENRLELAKRTLKWKHLSPTSPDTLDSYPYRDRDPFVIDQAPHVYFVGNQVDFGYDVVEVASGKTLVVTLPNFAQSGFCALVNLRNFTVEAVNFSID